MKKLEELMTKLFNFYMSMPKENWTKSNLVDIADYINGLPMQKFRPTDEKYLPVIKIRELSQGYIDSNSERVTRTLSKNFIVDDGDIIFAWSGTLLVRIWCGGTGGLNQHLFKVTSKKYPKWFYYLWTKHHLEHFQRIAQGKAVTMGHIKRGDLESAKVFIPSTTENQTLNDELSPLLDGIICFSIENTKLNQLKTLYLKKFFI